MPGINPNSSGISNRIPVPGLGVNPILGNAGSRITSSMGNISGGSIGRSITSGGLSVPGLASRVNLSSNSGSGSLNVQGTNRLKSGVLQQGIFLFFNAHKCLICFIYNFTACFYFSIQGRVDIFESSFSGRSFNLDAILGNTYIYNLKGLFFLG